MSNCKREGCSNPLAYADAEYCGSACSAQRKTPKVKSHKYTVDTKISMSLGIGLSDCRQDETFTLGDLIDSEQERLDTMSAREIESEIEEHVSDWAHNYIDFGWSEE